MLNIRSSDDVIEVLATYWQIHVSEETVKHYRETLQNLVKIARAEQIIGMAGDMNRVAEIQESSKKA